MGDLAASVVLSQSAMVDALSEDQLEEIIKEIDPEGKGHVDFQEFLLLQARRLEQKESEEDVMVLGAFKIFAKDNSGAISSDAMRHIFQELAGMPEKEVN